MQGRVFSRKNYPKHLQQADEPSTTPAHHPLGEDPQPPTPQNRVSILGNLDIFQGVIHASAIQPGFHGSFDQMYCIWSAFNWSNIIH